MRMDDVIKIEIPVPDSQYRLIPCRCKSDNAAYVKYKKGCEELWRVQCFDCGLTVDVGTTVRHTVQIAWNERMRPGKEGMNENRTD